MDVESEGCSQGHEFVLPMAEFQKVHPYDCHCQWGVYGVRLGMIGISIYQILINVH